MTLKDVLGLMLSNEKISELVGWLLRDAANEEKAALGLLSGASAAKAQPSHKDGANPAQVAARMANLEKARALRWAGRRRSKRKARRVYEPGEDTKTGKVWAALKQSSGPILAGDLAQILEMSHGDVSKALYVLHSKKSTLSRERYINGGRGAAYAYRYTGKEA